MTTDLNNTPSAAVTTLNPIDNTNMSVTPQTDTPPVNQEQAENITTEVSEQNASSSNTEAIIDPEKKLKLENSFAKAISDPRFWENPKRIIRLEEIFEIPRYEDRSKQQFYISARNELISKAIAHSIKSNTVAVMPTDEEICVLAEKKYSDKQKAMEQKNLKEKNK